MTNKFATSIHQDLPFCNTPIIWKYFSDFYFGNLSAKRFHNPYLPLNKKSPDTTEEFILKNNCKDYEKFYLNYLGEDFQVMDLKKTLDEHIK